MIRDSNLSWDLKYFGFEENWEFEIRDLDKYFDYFSEKMCDLNETLI